jgi:hypothetical protein
VRPPDKEDWRNLLYLSEFDFPKSWHRRGLVILLGFILVLTWAQLGKMILSASQLWNWANGLAVVLGLAPLGIAVWLDHKWGRFLFSSEQFEGFLLLMLLFCFGPALGALAGSLSGNWVEGVMVGMVVGAGGGAVGGVAGGAAGTAGSVASGVVLRAGLGAVGGAVIGAAAGMVSGAMGNATFGVMGGGLVSLVVIMVSSALVGADRDEVAGIAVNSLVVGMVGYGPSALVYGLGGLLGLVAFWGLWLAVALGIYWDAKRCERAAANPLHGLLDAFNPTPIAPRRQGWVSFLRLGLFSRRSRN